MAVARVFPVARVNVVGGWLCRPARGRQQARLDAIQLKWRSAAYDRCWRHLAATADDSNTSRQPHRLGHCKPCRVYTATVDTLLLRPAYTSPSRPN